MRHIKSFKIYENYHPGKEVEIRPATKDEITEFVKTMNSRGMPYSSTNILDVVTWKDNEVHGAFVGGGTGKMVAGMTMKDHRNVRDAMEIPGMIVDPEHEKKGIGELMIAYAGDNTDKSMLLVNPYTWESQGFFKKIGFVKDENIDPDDHNTMIKKI